MRKTVTATPLSLAEVRQEIDQRLEGLFEVKIKQAHGIDPLYGQMLERMALFIRRGGKRMRPYLTYLSYIGCGGSDTAAILDVAASQELYHNFLLIHDDIIDRDLMRYDGPNLSGLYMEKFQKELADLGEARHYADAMAMLAGDLNCGLAFGVIAESNFSDELKTRATSRMSQMVFEIGGGEMLDVLIPLLPDKEVTHQRLLQVCHYKTASYSFAAPLQLGAIMADAANQAIKGLNDYAIPVGIAFQMTDDLLGVFGQEKDLGKPVLTDLREGKRTILMAYGLELGNETQKDFLISCLGNPDIKHPQLERVRQILIESGAKAKTEQLARRYAELARRNLKQLDLTEEATTELASLTEFAVGRQR